MNIRIGNDITLNVALNTNELLDKSVLCANAYLVHDMSQSNVLSSKSDIFSEYMIHGCGAPHYLGGIVAYPHDRGFNVCGHGCMHCNHLKKIPLCVDVLSNVQLRCKFLKESQKVLGDYWLVVCVTTRERCCRKTYTYSFGKVFCLTDNEGDRSGDVVIDLPNDKSEIIAIKPINTIIALPSGTSMNIGDIDFYGNKYGFKILTRCSAQVEYHPNGSFENFVFSSKNQDMLTIDENGTITSADSENSTNVVIEVRDTEDENIKTQMVVHIIGSESDEFAITYAALGTELKLNITANLGEHLHLCDVNFTTVFYSKPETGRQVVINKDELVEIDDDNYVAIVDTDKIGTGEYWMKLFVYIPDEDCPDGYRTEVVNVPTGVKVS